MKMKNRLLFMLFSVFLIASCATTDSDSFTIAIAWRDDVKSESFHKVYDYLSSSGGNVVVLDKATSADLAYYDGNISDEYLNYDFSISEECARIIKATRNIDAPDLSNIDLIVFTGGEDISPSLYRDEYEIAESPIYNPERDVSDYLLMRYAIDKGIPILGICRGFEMMGIVSGAELIDDIPTYLTSLGADNIHIHRSEDGKSAFHDITIISRDYMESLGKLTSVASAHHQSIDYSSSGNIRVLAINNEYGSSIVESGYIVGEGFAFGVQFHPEYYKIDSKYYQENQALLKEIMKKAR